MFYLITGRAGAGKSTYAYRYAKDLRESGRRVCVLDADQVRRHTGNDKFTVLGIYTQMADLSNYALLMGMKGFDVIIAAVAPMKVYRDYLRARFMECRTIYIPGGHMWPETEYEVPDEKELWG